MDWNNDFDRPNFFFEPRDRYLCYPGDATIVERVTGVTVSIAEPYEGSYAGFPRRLNTRLPGAWAAPATFTAIAPASSAPAMPTASHPGCFGERAEKSPASASCGLA